MLISAPLLRSRSELVSANAFSLSKQTSPGRATELPGALASTSTSLIPANTIAGKKIDISVNHATEVLSPSLDLESSPQEPALFSCSSSIFDGIDTIAARGADDGIPGLDLPTIIPDYRDHEMLH